ncbi:hypothetical protein [Umezawaea beigongshangensis]|uniref:hypothetical protein n=1 Tax=Umezawaea beigongshangensis TaxID=2780383 RepID=UPI0018F22A8E|nr:hypothetical protein [Umezawaea beigongshangensis]
MDDAELPERYQRPSGVGDKTVEAVGKLSEALEKAEAARGHLYAFHQITGSADFAAGDAARLLREAGHHELADVVEFDLVGRNVLLGRWTFQIVDEYDEDYHRTFREVEKRVRDELVAGRKHLLEAELKQTRRTRGHVAHTATPAAEEVTRA